MQVYYKGYCQRLIIFFVGIYPFATDDSTPRSHLLKTPNHTFLKKYVFVWHIFHCWRLKLVYEENGEFF